MLVADDCEITLCGEADCGFAVIASKACVIDYNLTKLRPGSPFLGRAVLKAAADAEGI